MDRRTSAKHRACWACARSLLGWTLGKGPQPCPGQAEALAPHWLSWGQAPTSPPIPAAPGTRCPDWLRGRANSSRWAPRMGCPALTRAPEEHCAPTVRPPPCIPPRTGLQSPHPPSGLLQRTPGAKSEGPVQYGRGTRCSGSGRGPAWCSGASGAWRRGREPREVKGPAQATQPIRTGDRGWTLSIPS